MYACSPKWEGWISGKDLKTVLGFLIKQDFKGLLLFARDFGFQESEEGYISKCDLCLEIRKYLLTKKEFDELKPTEFYSHLK
jgi:hypothetical protein